MYRSKVINLDISLSLASHYRAAGLSIGLCHGCFDILHIGHIRHFVAASRQVDVLFVSVTPDEYVNKGPARPINALAERLEHLSAIAGIDFVLPNSWSNAVDLLKIFKPDVYFKGQEYEHLRRDASPGFWLERDVVCSYGGDVKFTYEKVSSTTSIVEKVLKNHDIKK